VGGRLVAGEVAVKLLESRDALVGWMQRQIAEAIDQLEDGRGPQLAFTQYEPGTGPCVVRPITFSPVIHLTGPVLVTRGYAWRGRLVE
jgi:hypothetical protein